MEIKEEIVIALIKECYYDYIVEGNKFPLSKLKDIVKEYNDYEETDINLDYLSGVLITVNKK